MRILLLIFISLNCSADLSFGEIEEIIFVSEYDERKIQIYFPGNKIIDSETTFIIMNDGEELFNAGDSWHNKEWGIDEKLNELSINENNFKIVIIAVDSAKKGQGLFIDETKRYAEYFPKEAIDYFENGLKKKLYQKYINQESLHYLDFLIQDLIPFLEDKFMMKLDNQNLGIIGASMGGLSALNALIENPQKFKFAGCISTHWVGIRPSSYLLLPITQNVYGDKATTNAIIKYVENNINNLGNQKVYFDHGTEGLDSLYADPQATINSIFEENKKDYKSLIFKGEDHDAPYFGGRIDYVLNYLINTKYQK